MRIISVILLGLTLTGCGYDGHYRYPCQDPANWEKKVCKPPICTAAGACPEDLVGKNITDNTSEEITVEELINE